jgi:hypothetical protein
MTLGATSTGAPKHWVCILGDADADLTSLRLESHKIPDSLSAFWRIVSFTVMKSSRKLLMSESSVMLRSSEGQNE